MKAFISHSSRDKHIAREVADHLGDMRAEFDEYTFDFRLNAAEIRKALKRSDLFVLLLSENSTKSDFVDEETRSALEARAAGHIRQVVVIALDDTSYKSLPEWMREINVAQKLSTPRQIGRRVDAYLTEMELQEGERDDYYFGRDSEERELRKSLARPRATTPVFVSVVGTHGIGRRTFLANALRSAAPRHYGYILQVTIDEYDSTSELYRKLYELMEVSNPVTMGEDFARFEQLEAEQKIQRVGDYIEQISSDGGIVAIIDEGGVLGDDGDLREPYPKLLQLLSNSSRPKLAFIQTRMMRYKYKPQYPRHSHIRLNTLSDETVTELLGLMLKELNVEFTEADIVELAKHTEGEPLNIRLLASYVAEEGIDVFLSDPSEIVELKSQRGQDYLRKIAFSSMEVDVVSALREYQFCDIEFLKVALGSEDSGSGAILVEAVRRLEDFCCVERRDRLLTISPPLRDAIRRDRRFQRSNEWLRVCASRIVDATRQYSDEDSVSLSFVDAALPDLLRSGVDIPLVSALVLPSHFLRVGRDYYDKGNWQRSAEFCERAINVASQLSIEGRIEANRLLGLAYTRMDERDPRIDMTIQRLRSYNTKTSRRVAHFIEGFRARRSGDYDTAESKFVEASKLDRDNYHINRELSAVLCRVGRYAEAEPYARSAYNRAPDNPYILDVLIECIEGKAAQGLQVDRQEMLRLNDELKVVCDDGGFQFFNIREARRQFDLRKRVEAFTQMDAAVKATASDPVGYFQRGKMLVRAGSLADAQRDVKSLRDLGKTLPEAVRYADELEAEVLVADGRFSDAKAIIDTRFRLAVSIEGRLTETLRRAIAYSPAGATPQLREWAKKG